MQTTKGMRWPENIEHVVIDDKTYSEIFKFYNNVGKKYINTYGREEINKLIRNNFYPITKLDNTKLLSDPILDIYPVTLISSVQRLTVNGPVSVK